MSSPARLRSISASLTTASGSSPAPRSQLRDLCSPSSVPTSRSALRSTNSPSTRLGVAGVVQLVEPLTDNHELRERPRGGHHRLGEVGVGVYGYAARRACADGWGGGSVFRALKRVVGSAGNGGSWAVERQRLDARHDCLKKGTRAAFHLSASICSYIVLPSLEGPTI